MSARFDRLHLASSSPRRREILQQMGVRFSTLLLRQAPGRPADVDETPLPGEDPAEYVLRVARLKAAAGWDALVARRLPQAPLLAADTTVALDGQVIGKPASPADAVDILLRLSGRAHHVHTAVAVRLGDRLESRLSSTRVAFGPVDRTAAERYAASGEPMDKAGAYGIQGRAAVFVESIEGSYTGVMGLPAWDTAALLGAFGMELP